MKKLIITILCASLTGIAYGKDEKVRVPFTMEELTFSINVLNTIDIVGEEVMPFMDVKNLLMAVHKDASSGNKKNVNVDFTITTAKNFVFLLQRARLKGAEAIMFNDICNKAVEAIKKVEK